MKEGLEGLRFDNFVVVKYSHHLRNAKGICKYYWECICDCGKTFLRTSSSIVAKTKNKSCGCVREKINAEIRTKHNLSKTRFHNIYMRMKNRVLNPNHDKFRYYGGRGIGISQEWRENFLNFQADMHESYLEHVASHGEKNTTLDRIDFNGDYSKGNCRWATQQEQMNNTRKSIKGKIKAVNIKNGEEFVTNTVREMAERLNMDIKKNHIYSVLNGKRNQTKGYNFCLID